MTETLSVRVAQRRDAGALMDLLGSRLDGAADVHVGLAMPLTRTLVAVRGGRCCGALQLRARPTAPRWEAHVTALEGPDPHVADALLDAADMHAALLGADALVVSAHEAGRPAHGFDASGERRVRFGSGADAGGHRSTVEGADGARFLRVAARAANAVGAAVAAHRQSTGPLDPGDKSLDLHAERAAVGVLAELELPVFSEESGWLGPPIGPDSRWISLDPIDGTRNCLRGYPPWAVSVGLVDAGRAVAGLVVDLSCGRRWWAAPGADAHVDGVPARPRADGLLVLPSTAPDALPELAGVGGHSRLRVAGATAVDLCRVADGAAGAFLDLHREISQPHDIAAATAILDAAGGTILDAETDAPPRFDHRQPERHYKLAAAATAHHARALLDAAALTRSM